MPHGKPAPFQPPDRPHLPSVRRGALLPLIAVCMVVLFVAVTISVDIARIQLTRAELRTATDAAARAGTEALSRTQNPAAARQAAIEIAARNRVAGQSLSLAASQIELGNSAPDGSGAFVFSPGGTTMNSVRVTGLRTTASLDGPVPMFFGPLFGVTQFQPTQSASATRLDRDIAMVLDVSGSMRGSPFDGLQNAVRVFLAQLRAASEEPRVSLIVYSTTGRKLVNLTSDLNQIASVFARESADGFTAIGEGLRLGDQSVRQDPLARAFAQKTVILMTDGIHNTGVNPEVVVDGMRNVTVHTVTFGAGANRTLMQRVAAKTGGVSEHADNNLELERVFREIAAQLPVLLTE